MIGKVQQQWGYQTVHGTNPVTYDLPIPFEEAPFTVAISTGNSGNHASCGGFTKTTIVLRAGTTAGVWDTVGFFIIGCQLQWGYCVGKNNVTFPIPFNSVWTVLGNAHGSNNSNNDHYFLGEFSTTGARFYYSNMNLTGTAWIAIGDC